MLREQRRLALQRRIRVGELRFRRRAVGLDRAEIRFEAGGVERGEPLSARDEFAKVDVAGDDAARDAKAQVGLIAGLDDARVGRRRIAGLDDHAEHRANDGVAPRFSGTPPAPGR